MNRLAISRLIGLTASGICAVGFTGSAFAAAMTHSMQPVQAPSLPAPTVPRILLDLRAATIQGEAAGIAFGHSSPDASPAARGPDSQSSLNIGEASFRTTSPLEEFARRVHREGLPIARLWETKSALLSVGLNQRGKPGVWFTKRMQAAP